MANLIKLRQAEGNWVVRAGGAILGETSRAIELVEGDYPAVIYFPRADIAMPFLEPSKTTSHCPHKGDATYFSIQTKSVLIEDAAWSYEAPLKDVAQIAGHIAFYGNKVAVERV
ncbi:MAG: hypothetical protein ACJA06_002029 [Halocynthiibacter sp.]|jgi:uncharacterized protein (DUF427 family)